MKLVSTLLITIAISGLASARSSNKCTKVCPFLNLLGPTSTKEEIIFTNLDTNPPPTTDCVCTQANSTKYILKDDCYDLPAGGFCFDFPVGKGGDAGGIIKPGQGQKCADEILFKEPSLTLGESFVRNFNLLKDITPENGWCPEDRYKFIVKGELIGENRDLCMCISSYFFNCPTKPLKTPPSSPPPA